MKGGLHPYCKQCRSTYAPRRRKNKFKELLDQGLKKCPHCKQVKTLDNFYQLKSGPYHPRCKECQKERSQTIEFKQTQQRYYRTKERQESLKNYTSRPEIKSRINEQHKQYAKSHPDKSSARRAVGDAVKGGKIPPAKMCNCVVCQKPARDYHHYLGYERQHRLDVVPVCRSCHPKLDKGEIAYPVIAP